MRRSVVILIAVAALFATLPPARGQETPETKFWKACRNGDVVTVRELLDKGMSPNASFEGGVTPLVAASMRGQVEVVKLLVERGADISLRDGSFKLTPLGMATFFGQMSIVEFLLPRSTEDMDLVLVVGAQRGIPALVQAGLKGKVTGQDLTIALVVAKRGKNTEIPAMLEKAGAEAAPTLSPADMARFTGEFSNKELKELQVILRDGKLLATGGQGFGSFFEEETVPISSQVLFLAGDPTTTFRFEGPATGFDRVTIKSFSGSYTVQKTKGEGK